MVSIQCSHNGLETRSYEYVHRVSWCCTTQRPGVIWLVHFSVHIWGTGDTIDASYVTASAEFLSMSTGSNPSIAYLSKLGWNLKLVKTFHLFGWVYFSWTVSRWAALGEAEMRHWRNRRDRTRSLTPSWERTKMSTRPLTDCCSLVSLYMLYTCIFCAYTFCNGTRMIPEAQIMFLSPLFDIVHQMEGRFDTRNNENLWERHCFCFWVGLHESFTMSNIEVER